MERHDNRGFGRIPFALMSVYSLLVVAAVVSIKIGAPSVNTGAPSATHSIYSGPDGVQSRAIVDENQKIGTTSWQIAPGTSPTVIQGFSSSNQAQVGQVINLYVTTS